MESNFDYVTKSGLFQFNTLSPNGKFYYKLSNPKDYHWGAWAAKLRFYNEENDLIYSNDSILSRAYSDIWNNLIFVAWSDDGNFAIIHEYSLDDIYNYALLDFNTNQIYRLPLDSHNREYFNNLQNENYCGRDVMDEMEKHNIHFERLPIKVSWWNNILTPVRYPQNAKL